MEKMQAQADAAEYIRKGYKVTDPRIERYYRSNPAAAYSLNEFLDAVYLAADDVTTSRHKDSGTT